MDTVISLGASACKVADEFSKYPQYEIYKIDVGVKGTNCFNIPKYSSPEEYEKKCPNFINFFSKVSGDVLFILNGSESISGASLSILKYIKDTNINILYLLPDITDLSGASLLQNKLVFNVLQEYARSGLFNRMYIISYSEIEKIIGDIPILQYNKKINEFIVSTIHYINIFNNTEPVVDNHEQPHEISRICTFGLLDVSSGEEKYLFPIKNEKDKIYFFGIPEEILNTDGKLLRNIRDLVSQNQIKSGYEIHCTKHDNIFCYFTSFSNVIQTLDN